MSVVSRMEDGVFDHAIDISRFEEGMRRKTIGFLKEMSDDISRLLSDSPTQIQSDRLNALLKQVDGVIEDAHKSAAVDMRNQLLDFAPIEEKATTQIMNDSLKADLFSPQMTEAQLRAVVDDSLVRGALASDWWDRLGNNTKNKITKGIQLGIAEGEGMGQIKARLLGRTTGQFETIEVGGKTVRRAVRVGGWIQASNREAEAVIRTSVHTVASKVRDETYKNNLDVIDQIESVATLDGRTTPLCASYDGLRWNAENHEPVGGHGKIYRSTPRHWGCRSTHVPVIGELDRLDKIAKTKGLKIPRATKASIQGPQRATMNMDKWLRKQSNEMQDKIVGGKTKGNLFRNKTKLRLKDFTDRRGDPISIQDLRSKFGDEFLKITREQVKPSTPASPFMNAAFVDTNLGTKKKGLGKAVVDAEVEFTGLERPSTGKKKHKAWYQPWDGKIAMGTHEKYDPKGRRGIGTMQHEYGHHMDHALGRKLLNADDVYTIDGKEVQLTRTRYGEGREGKWEWNIRLSDTNIMEDAIAKDEIAFLRSAGYLPNLDSDGLRITEKARGREAKRNRNQARRQQNKDNQKKAGDEMRDHGETMRKAFLEERYKRIGIDKSDVESVIQKDTAFEGMEGFRLDEKVAKIGQALEDRDAENLFKELAGNDDVNRTLTFKKGFNVPAFSDLLGSASKNRILGHNSERSGHFGHGDSYYRQGLANTEVFANVTALKSTNEPFWDKVLDVFVPETSKAYDELLDLTNEVKWENDKQRLFSKVKKD